MLFPLAFVLFTSLVSAGPHSIFEKIRYLISQGSQIERRACVSDVATVGFGRGTTGGIGGPSTTATTLAQLQAAVSGNDPKIVYISGTLIGNAVVNVGSNTSVVGIAGSLLSGIGLRILNSENVIVRNVRIAKVLADTGDAIGIQSSSKVWVDHTELSSDLDHDKDYYGGLLDITHGSNAITVTYTILSNSWKGSTVGHSDANGDEDKAFTVSYGLNYWAHLNNRVPTVRFGTVHIFNNYFLDNNDGCNVRNGAQVLLENNVWDGCLVTVFPTNGGQAVLRGNDYGAATPPTTTTGTFVVAPYNLTILPTSQVKAVVLANAGQKLTC